ncbi:MAG: hypothetical protein AMXMBFR33_28630 [Candidatus Xenobia bacterium]
MRFRLLLALLIIAGLIRPVWGQLPETTDYDSDFGPLVREPIFASANASIEVHDWNGAMAKYEQVAVEHPNTGYEAAARIRMANIWYQAGQLDRARSETDQVVARFPNSSYWFIARRHQLQDRGLSYREATDQVLSEIGAPSLDQVASSQVDPAFTEDSLPRYYRWYACKAYSLMLVSRSAPPVELLNSVRFLRRAFPRTEGGDQSHVLVVQMMGLPGAPPMPQGMEPEHVPPVILSLQPGPGQVADGSLVIRAGDGNMWQQQIDIEEIQLLVDGQDVTRQLLFDTDLTLDPTRPHFEILTIRYPLPPGLAPGAHSATLTVGDDPTISPSNKTVTTWSFVVPSSQPLSVELDVLSKHVKPHKNEQARVRATATNPPTSLSYSIYRGGQGGPPLGSPVLTVQDLPAPSGALELVWDGTDASGQQVANGSYLMVVTARDNAGHEASSSAHLVVNFQGGGQGARSFWQLALPRWLSPGDALRLAFPIPCLGAELAGNYLFSPEQLSTTGIGLSN